jgi:hypothetical protein
MVPASFRYSPLGIQRITKALGESHISKGYNIGWLELGGIPMLHKCEFCLCEFDLERSIQSTSIFYLPQMGRIWHPKSDKPLVFIRVDVVQERNLHSTVVSIKEEKRGAIASVVHPKSVKILEHISQNSGFNAGLWQCAIEAGNVFPLK